MRTAIVLALCLTAATPVLAEAPWWRYDRLENRIDRRESLIDRRMDFGWADVVEDRFDRREDRADRRDRAVLPRFNGHERRTIRRILRRH